MIDVTNYWERRYSTGHNSGKGSYGEENVFKFSYIKEIIETYNLKSINDFWCGDGNQIKQLRPPYIAHEIAYKGWDVSKTAVNKCTEMYKDVSSYTFSHDISEWDAADLGLSLDVLYHIVDEDIFYTYLDNLFNKSKQYVIIYAVNHNLSRNNSHIHSRPFVDYVVEKYDCELVDTRPYPPKIGRGEVAFYLFKK